MSSVSKNASSVPSHTEPPRGTMASPNTVMTIDPVRDGSRFNCWTMRASGGMRQGIARFAELQQWLHLLLLPVLHGEKVGMRGSLHDRNLAIDLYPLTRI